MNANTHEARVQLERYQHYLEQDAGNSKLLADIADLHLQLGEIENGPFEAVFSDLGGLNCIPDLRPVIEKLPSLLKSGSLVTWVLMPPICLWELGWIFKGDFRFAFRRLSANGTRAHLEGKYRLSTGTAPHSKR